MLKPVYRPSLAVVVVIVSMGMGWLMLGWWLL